MLEDVTGEEFVLFMKILSGLKSLQTVSGRQQLVELVAEQADLEQTFNPSDPDCVDRLLQCTRQAVPLFSVSIYGVLFFKCCDCCVNTAWLYWLCQNDYPIIQVMAVKSCKTVACVADIYIYKIACMLLLSPSRTLPINKARPSISLDLP